MILFDALLANLFSVYLYRLFQSSYEHVKVPKWNLTQKLTIMRVLSFSFWQGMICFFFLNFFESVSDNEIIMTIHT